MSSQSKNPATESSKMILATFQNVITPRNAIAADFIRIVFDDCRWRDDYSPLLEILLVCKEWFQFVIPLLWRKVTINSAAAGNSFVNGISSPERGHLYKRYLRAITTPLSHELSEQWIRNICTCLETGAPLFEDLNGSLGHLDFVDAIGPNLRRQLKGLTIDSLRGEHFQLFPNLKRLDFLTILTEPSVFRKFITFAPQLTKIRVFMLVELNPYTFRMLESLVNVEDLQILFDGDDQERIIDIWGEEFLIDIEFRRALEDPSRVFLPKLTSLRIETDGFWRSKKTSLAFFRRIRETLTKLELIDDGCYNVLGGALCLLSYTGDHQNRENNALSELAIPYMPKGWRKINFANFKTLESLEFSSSVEQPALIRIAKSCGDTLRRFSFIVHVGDRTYEGGIENYSSTVKRFLDACPHLEELKVKFLRYLGGIDGDAFIDEYVCDGVAHSKLRVLRVKMVRIRSVSEDNVKRSMGKVWKQCPNLLSIFWDGVCFDRV